MVPTQDAPDILIVDDKSANLRVLAEMLRAEGYRVRPARSGEAAIQAALLQTPDLVLLDVMMPEMDGFEVCRRLKSIPETSCVPVVFLSALDATQGKLDAFTAGGVDYVTKPFHVDEVRARVRTHLQLRRLQREVEEYSHRLEKLVCEQVEEIENSQMATIFALARLAESRDDETGNHLGRVRTYCRMLAGSLSGLMPAGLIDNRFVRNLEHASLLHDIGKVAISDSILLKPASLTSQEFEVMKTHTSLGSETLEAVRNEYPRNQFLAMGIDIARSHHERWDGSGYPDGLSGESIPLSARIMAVADVYDALRSRRVYKDPLSHAESRRIILEGSGSHFDPGIIGVFAELEGDFERVYAQEA